ncbi:hemerythrin domain-containing protein [Sphingosinicella sp. LHD-64]|uniref:hemerythrin domain-containing protein n=1 Tax=Sphingosinicella sp. LHD-64 TaxID=3072139 RepID=UPI00280DE6F7|nr:hemerythrin domain-containing protein [Sphingosinicella sp. LHD-64]MDQ8757828.1 hemerythrin domain-containing protein [Sphingosinicella sp. LHD-64]
MANAEFADAIAVLRAGHRTLENLFQAFAHARDRARKARLARQICTELKIHTLIEEEVFYPAFSGRIDGVTLAAICAGHDGVMRLVDAIEAGDDGDACEGRIAALRAEIAPQVKKLERPSNGLFARCRRTGVDLLALRDRLVARRDELAARAERDGLPPIRLARPRPIPA